VHKRSRTNACFLIRNVDCNANDLLSRVMRATRLMLPEVDEIYETVHDELPMSRIADINEMIQATILSFN